MVGCFGYVCRIRILKMNSCKEILVFERYGLPIYISFCGEELEVVEEFRFL